MYLACSCNYYNCMLHTKAFRYHDFIHDNKAGKGIYIYTGTLWSQVGSYCVFLTV